MQLATNLTKEELVVTMPGRLMLLRDLLKKISSDVGFTLKCSSEYNNEVVFVQFNKVTYRQFMRSIAFLYKSVWIQNKKGYLLQPHIPDLSQSKEGNNKKREDAIDKIYNDFSKLPQDTKDKLYFDESKRPTISLSNLPPNFRGHVAEFLNIQREITISNAGNSDFNQTRSINTLYDSFMSNKDTKIGFREINKGSIPDNEIMIRNDYGSTSTSIANTQLAKRNANALDASPGRISHSDSAMEKQEKIKALKSYPFTKTISINARNSEHYKIIGQIAKQFPDISFLTFSVPNLDGSSTLISEHILLLDALNTLNTLYFNREWDILPGKIIVHRMKLK